MFSADQKYARLENRTLSFDDDVESEKSACTVVPPPDRSSSSSNTRKAFLVFQLAFFGLSSLLLVSSLLVFWKAEERLRNGTIVRSSIYSPILDRLPLPESTIKFNGSFLNTHPPSIYRQDPSADVDAAWEYISRAGALPITSADVRAIGKNPLLTAKWPPSAGLGPDAHIASIDVFHQIHCLNEMRKWIHPHYYFSGLNISDPPLAAQKTHITHCTYLLLQNLMCHADVEVYTWRWVDVQKHPLPDFHVNKQCRSFDAVLQYRDEHDWDFDAVKMPVDATPAKAPPDFLDLFEKWDYVGNRPVPVEER